MENVNSRKLNFSNGKTLLFFPVFYNTINFLYCLYSGQYTGDYLGVSIGINFSVLFIVYLLSLMPFFILWKIYVHFKRKSTKEQKLIRVNKSFFCKFVYFIFAWQIFVSLFFGVGVLGDDPYQAPAAVKIFIQIFNRFPVTLMAIFYIALHGKDDLRAFFKMVVLLIIAGISKHSISAPIFAIYLFIVFWGNLFVFWIRKYFLLICLSCLLLPTVVSSIYTLRDTLREKENVASLSTEKMIFGKFFGRLSTYSNFAFIVENRPYFAITSLELDKYYYQRQALSGTIGMQFAPEITPEKVLFNSLGDGSPNVSYACGVGGNLLMSLLKSSTIFLLNFCTLILLLILTFFLIEKIDISNKFEIALLLQMGPMMSGVVNECAFVPFTIFIFILFVIISNNFISFFKTSRVS